MAVTIITKQHDTKITFTDTPTIDGQKYNLTFRMYGPAKDVVDGTYFLPALVKM